MSELVQIGGHRRGLAANRRTDRWWIEPLVFGGGFAAFVVYTTWAMLQANHYYVGPHHGFGGYLSPFYSPVLFVDPHVAGAAPMEHAWFGGWPGWWPHWLPSSPAMLILLFPLSFRVTCYYYRKFYYRSYFLSPPGCAVGALPMPYKGETRVFLFQNLHRYAMYFAVAFVVILSWDAVKSYFMDGKPGIGVGSIILTINPILIAGYTFGCHSLRHLMGGKLDCYSCGAAAKARYGLWRRITRLNEHHQLWAWMSLLWVAGTDLYVRLVSMGVIHDWNTWS
jgi:hypothetical protein